VFLFATPNVRMAVGGVMKASRFGLQAKIIIIIAVAVVSVATVSTYIAMLLTRQLVEEEVYRKALAQARATAHQLVNGGALKSPDRLQQVLRQMMHDLQGVRQADVYLHEPVHHLEATTQPQATHLELDNLPNIDTYNEFERPDDDEITIETEDGKFWIMGVTIRNQGVPVGCLNLLVSKLQTSVVTRNLVRQNVLVMLASLASLFLVIHIFFLRAVRRPVKEMIRVMESAEGGQLDVRARLQSWDEIGLLAAHLNRMLRRIENFNNELGHKVEEATAELARRNEELRRINEELFETQKNLARSERLAVAGQLAASLAHEIGTPLNSIYGHVQLLARRKTNDDSTARRLLVIEKQVENIVRTVKQLLSWTRKYELRLELLDLGRVLEDAVFLSSPVLELRKIRVHMNLAKDCPKVYGDSAYLHQVFLNLINNSTDAMSRGGRLRLELRAPAHGEPSEVTVDVADTGTGMSPETLAHIFDPMFTTKQIGTGAGLGLAICDQIVRQHGGAIHVESEPGRGTTFTIRLPLDCRERMEAVVAGAVTTPSSSV
jgi:two-component system, NtrC family, sensor kinase